MYSIFNLVYYYYYYISVLIRLVLPLVITRPDRVQVSHKKPHLSHVFSYMVHPKKPLRHRKRVLGLLLFILLFIRVASKCMKLLQNGKFRIHQTKGNCSN